MVQREPVVVAAEVYGMTARKRYTWPEVTSNDRPVTLASVSAAEFTTSAAVVSSTPTPRVVDGVTVQPAELRS